MVIVVDVVVVVAARRLLCGSVGGSVAGMDASASLAALKIKSPTVGASDPDPFPLILTNNPPRYITATSGGTFGRVVRCR